MKNARITLDKDFIIARAPHTNGNATIDGCKVTAGLPKLYWNVIRLKRNK